MQDFHLFEIQIPQFYKKTKNCSSDIGNYLRKIHLGVRELILVGGGGETWWDQNLMGEFNLVGEIVKSSATWGIPPSVGKTLTPGIKSESTNN